MIDRYVLPQMQELLSDSARLQRWLDVEMAVLRAWADAGRIPAGVADGIGGRLPQVDHEFISAVAAREAEVRHDVAAFVDVLAAALGEDGRWIHFGLTSSDVVDTALALTLRSASELIVGEALLLFDALADVARRHRADAMIGRSHGVHAELITFGSKIALLALQVSRCTEAFFTAAADASVGKMSGPMGNYSVVEPEIEQRACKELYLTPISASQVIPRDLHAQYVFALARLTTAVEAIALQVRLGHQTEVGELYEGFSQSQKGSSAMPHKQNPVQAERLCGLSRVVRGMVAPVLENVALWHERDISHSAVERIVVADACSLTHFALTSCSSLVHNWDVDLARMKQNVASSNDVLLAPHVLHALVESGWTRDDAYRVVQSASQESREGHSFRQSLGAAGVPWPSLLDDPTYPLRHSDRSVDALDGCWASLRDR